MSTSSDYMTGAPSEELIQLFETVAESASGDTLKFREDKELLALKKVIVGQSYRKYTRQYCVFLAAVGKLRLDHIDFFWTHTARGARDRFAETAVRGEGWVSDEKNRCHFQLADGGQAWVSLPMIPFWIAFTEFLINVLHWDMFNNRMLRGLDAAATVDDCENAASWLDTTLYDLLKQHLPSSTSNSRFRTAISILQGERGPAGDALPGEAALNDDAVFLIWRTASSGDRGDWKTFRSARACLQLLLLIVARGQARRAGQKPVDSAEGQEFSDRETAEDDELDCLPETALKAQIRHLSNRQGSFCMFSDEETRLLVELTTMWPGPERLVRTLYRDLSYRATQQALSGGELLADAIGKAEPYPDLHSRISETRDMLQTRIHAIIDAASSGAHSGDPTVADAINGAAAVLDPQVVAATAREIAGLLEDEPDADNVVVLHRFRPEIDAMATRLGDEIRGQASGPGAAIHRDGRAAARRVRRAGIANIRNGVVEPDELIEAIELLTLCLNRLSAIENASQRLGDRMHAFEADNELFLSAFATIYPRSTENHAFE